SARRRQAKTIGNVAALIPCGSCSRITVRSRSQIVRRAVHTMRLVQNSKHTFVGGLDANWILLFADVPFLDFEISLGAFCDYTNSSGNQPPYKPSLWQRPLDSERVDHVA